MSSRRQIIHNKVAKAVKTNHCRSLVETVLSSWPLGPCCEISGYLVAALPQRVLCVLLFGFFLPVSVAGCRALINGDLVTVRQPIGFVRHINDGQHLSKRSLRQS